MVQNILQLKPQRKVEYLKPLKKLINRDCTLNHTIIKSCCSVNIRFHYGLQVNYGRLYWAVGIYGRRPVPQWNRRSSRMTVLTLTIMKCTNETNSRFDRKVGSDSKDKNDSKQFLFISLTAVTLFCSLTLTHPHPRRFCLYCRSWPYSFLFVWKVRRSH